MIRAQKEGLAALERARGETAALRHLANAARMVEGNPALLQLRLIQAVGDGSGNTVVLGLSGQPNPLPIKASGGRPAPEALPEPPDNAG